MKYSCHLFTICRKNSNRMVMSPSRESNSCPTSQKFPSFHEIQKFIAAYKNIPRVTILNQTHYNHSLLHYSFKIHFNIVFQPKCRSSKWPLTFRFPDKSSYEFFISRACYMLI
jgi:hypothetical protein